MVKRVTVTKDHRITLPPAIRKELGIKPGDYLLVNVEDGYLVISPEPEDEHEHVNQECDACDDQTKRIQ